MRLCPGAGLPILLGEATNVIVPLVLKLLSASRVPASGVPVFPVPYTNLAWPAGSVFMATNRCVLSGLRKLSSQVVSGGGAGLRLATLTVKNTLLTPSPRKGSATEILWMSWPD